MKVLILAGLLAAGSIHAEAATTIPSNARIYVDAASGLDIYLTAALEKKHVPLSVTTDKSKADYELEAVTGVRLVNLKSGDVVFAWPVDKKSALHGRQTAETCAKRLAASVHASHSSEKHRYPGSSKDPAFDF
jgi:hypothetical protein